MEFRTLKEEEIHQPDQKLVEKSKTKQLETYAIRQIQIFTSTWMQQKKGLWFPALAIKADRFEVIGLLHKMS